MSLTDHIHNRLLPPLWEIVFSYLHRYPCPGERFTQLYSPDFVQLQGISATMQSYLAQYEHRQAQKFVADTLSRWEAIGQLPWEKILHINSLDRDLIPYHRAAITKIIECIQIAPIVQPWLPSRVPLIDEGSIAPSKPLVQNQLVATDDANLSTLDRQLEDESQDGRFGEVFLDPSFVRASSEEGTTSEDQEHTFHALRQLPPPLLSFLLHRFMGGPIDRYGISMIVGEYLERLFCNTPKHLEDCCKDPSFSYLFRRDNTPHSIIHYSVLRNKPLFFAWGVLHKSLEKNLIGK